MIPYTGATFTTDLTEGYTGVAITVVVKCQAADGNELTSNIKRMTFGITP